MTTSEVAASGTQGQAGYTPAQVHHVIYLNPSANSAHVMHQVKLTCKHNIYIDERNVLKIIKFYSRMPTFVNGHAKASNKVFVDGILEYMNDIDIFFTLYNFPCFILKSKNPSLI